MNRMERFMAKVISGNDDECWDWIGSKTGSGYGQFWEDGKLIPAHWFLLRERPEKGKEACHTCDNKLCVNPNHIFIGTRSDNMNDMISKGRGNYSKAVAAMRLSKRKIPKGSSHYASKLTESQVEEIRNCPFIFGAATKMAKRLGIDVSTLCSIRSGKHRKKK